jgi:hypothetical protein
MLFKSTVSFGSVGVLWSEMSRKHCMNILLVLPSCLDYTVDEL